MPFTPNYAIPYQTLADAPDGPNLGEDGFLATDAALAGLDVRIDALEAARFTRIGQITVSGPAPSVNFPGIASTWQAIEVTWTSRDDWVGFNADTAYMRVNGDGSVAYRHNYIQVNNASVTGATVVGDTRGLIGIAARGGATAGVFGGGRITIPAWSAPHANHLVWNCQSAIFDSAVGTCWSQVGSGVYTGAGPYTRLEFFPDPGAANFVAGTQFTVYGLP